MGGDSGHGGRDNGAYSNVGHYQAVRSSIEPLSTVENQGYRRHTS